MSTSSAKINSQSLFVDRVAPNYLDNELLVSLSFDTEIEFQAWFKAVASRHCHWITRNRALNKTNAKTVEGFSEEGLNACILPKETLTLLCDHHGNKASPRKNQVVELASADNAIIKKMRVQKNASIKVNCSAKITKISLYNGRVNITYDWKHVNHDPLDVKELATSRLPQSIRDWIYKQVSSNMDWKSIKATLRLSEESLDDFDMSQAFSKIPAGLLINHNVQNVIVAKRIDSASIYRLFCTSGDNRFQIFDFGGEVIDSDTIARSCKDTVFNSFFDRSNIERICRLHNLNFAHNVTILPGMKYVKILGTKKNKSAVITSTKKKEVSNNLPWRDIRKQQLKDNATLRAEIDNLKRVINEATQNLKRQALVIKNRNFSQAIIDIKRHWSCVRPLTKDQSVRNDQIYNFIKQLKNNRHAAHQTLYNIKKGLSDARYSQFTCRMAIYYRNSQHPGLTEHANHHHRRTIDKSPFIDKAENIRLPNYPEEINRNFSFSGTDNGIVKMTETVPLNLDRFAYHLKLYNIYSPLADIEEFNSNAEEFPFVPLPKALTINSGDIDFGAGHWRLRRKLEREKKFTGAGQLVTQIEKNLSSYNFSNATTMQEMDRVYVEQIVGRKYLRNFYGSKKRASEKRKVEILDYKFRNRLCTQERKCMKEKKKHLVMFIGDRGTGVDSTIKGYRRYSGSWKQAIHGKSTTACITNEYKTSQTCVYCFHPLSHPKQKVLVKGKIIQKSINGAFICYNQACISLRNNRN